MTKIPVILIFDIGKTNKKALLFNEDYEVVYEENVQFPEILDEDGFPCEDVNALTEWVKTSKLNLSKLEHFVIKATHYAAYGASFVYLNDIGEVITPLYNYLKPYKVETKALFESKYGPIQKIALETASPDLGNLNSGLQLYRLKVEQPQKYAAVKWALHLPQYIHYVVTGEIASDITSIGCHTMLWNYQTNQYHDWVCKEELDKKLPPIKNNVGLHDSSAALIPYLSIVKEKFILISTGTWCISLNPFNKKMLVKEELDNDVLFYFSNNGNQVKASRLFAGNMHELALKKITDLKLDDLQFEVAYKQLMETIVEKQIASTNLILDNEQLDSIYVDGGFSNNELYIKGLNKSYSTKHIFVAEVPHATALGAALSKHGSWNRKEIPDNLIKLKKSI